MYDVSLILGSLCWNKSLKFLRFDYILIETGFFGNLILICLSFFGRVDIVTIFINFS